MSCDHAYTVEDVHEGSIVCTDCCRVLDQVFACEQRNTYEQTFFSKDLSQFVDIFDTLFAPRTLITNFEKKVSDCLNRYKLKKSSHLIGACLYEYFIENSISRTLNEISAVLQTSTSLIWKTLSVIQKTSTNRHKILCPTQLTSRICHSLELDYKHYKAINEKLLPLCAKFPSHNPSTLVASVIYLYCKETKLKYTMKRVCSVVGISVISVQRFIKKLK